MCGHNLLSQEILLKLDHPAPLPWFAAGMLPCSLLRWGQVLCCGLCTPKWVCWGGEGTEKGNFLLGLVLMVVGMGQLLC